MEDWNERKSDVYNGAKEALEDVLGDFSVPRRERIATAVLPAFARSTSTAEEAARISVEHADALIAELDK